MEILNSVSWSSFLEDSLLNLFNSQPIPFMRITPSDLPVEPGVYVISEGINYKNERALYVGRTKNLRRRLYYNHLMGPLSNARIKKYFINDSDHEAFGSIDLAKSYLRDNCWMRWILEQDFRKRGALEGYFTARLFPKYGIPEEH